MYREDDLNVGDDVMKTSGDYNWRGNVCAKFRTPNGFIRYVVAHPVDKGHVLHIYSRANLQKLNGEG